MFIASRPRQRLIGISFIKKFDLVEILIYIQQILCLPTPQYILLEIPIMFKILIARETQAIPENYSKEVGGVILNLKSINLV